MLLDLLAEATRDEAELVEVDLGGGDGLFTSLVVGVEEPLESAGGLEGLPLAPGDDGEIVGVLPAVPIAGEGGLVSP